MGLKMKMFNEKGFDISIYMSTIEGGTAITFRKFFCIQESILPFG